MPSLVCTRHLANIGPCEPVDYEGGDVAALIQAASPQYPLLKNYVLDDQGALRKHVVVFVDGKMQPRAASLTAPLTPSSEVCIFQALSGG
jgi:sulfur-carrier protein